MEPIINLQDVSYKVGRKHLLKKVNLSIHKGENWVIFGLNGSGKTTLLSIIAGFKPPTEGVLTIDGQAYSPENVLDLRRQIGWISSSFFDRFFTKETALHVVLSGLSGSFGLNEDITDADVRYAKALLEELRVAHKMDTPFQWLSKGERQDVLIARAMITRPKILLLDEPDNGLDVYAREHTQNTIQALAERDDVTILYVTHYPESILPQFDHCLLLRHGQMIAQGETASLFTSAKLSELLNDDVTVTPQPEGGYRMKLAACSHMAELCYPAQQGGASDGCR
ncbi:MAG: ATP-binding cassette domain-containing protein [Peptococcaceae bacterium]|nr:ATP-binding cassette domain-containing protein [Peptococcaceae bacterium]